VVEVWEDVLDEVHLQKTHTLQSRTGAEGNRCWGLSRPERPRPPLIARPYQPHAGVPWRMIATGRGSGGTDA
jgi:hypothetical protein